MVEKHQVAQLRCSPKASVQEGMKSGYTCYSLPQLRELTLAYNNLRPDAPLPIDKRTRAQLHRQLMKAMDQVCADEFCWAEKTNLKHKYKEIFRPIQPAEWSRNKRTWLNTNDIVNVMKQYEDLHKTFRFLGVFPIDFTDRAPYGTCYGDEMCDFHIDKLKEAKQNEFAFVLNLDKHDEPGSHWVAVYCNIDPKLPNFGIFYYDSVGMKPGSYVSKFMENIRSQVNHKDFVVSHNKIQKQFKNTECGMFSMIFLTQCLIKKASFHEICSYMPKDDDINKLRDLVYLPRPKQM